MKTVLMTTDDAYLAIADLLTEEKRAMLARTAFGPLAIPHLEAIHERLAVLARRGTPYAAELAEADRRHDIGAVVLDHICHIHELLGSLPEHAELADVAQRLRGTLSMERGIIRASYGEEVANALRNRPLVESIDEELRAVPVARGVTARDVVELFVGGGEELGVYLRRRADALAETRAARSERGGKHLLNEARDLISRVRSALDAETSLRDDLPFGFVDRLFAVLDERLSVAAARQARGASAATVDGEGADGTVAEPLDLDGDAPEGPAPDAELPQAAAPDVEAAEAAAPDVEAAPEAAAPDLPEAEAPSPDRGPLRPLPGGG